MAKSQSKDSHDEMTYTSAMRIYGGVAWGSLLSFLVAVILILLPQVSRSWLWTVAPIWLSLCGIGVILQWSVARGACPKCGHRQSTTPMMTKCPKCRSYLKAVNRKIVKVG